MDMTSGSAYVYQPELEPEHLSVYSKGQRSAPITVDRHAHDALPGLRPGCVRTMRTQCKHRSLSLGLFLIHVDAYEKKDKAKSSYRSSSRYPLTSAHTLMNRSSTRTGVACHS